MQWEVAPGATAMPPAMPVRPAAAAASAMDPLCLHFHALPLTEPTPCPTLHVPGHPGDRPPAPGAGPVASSGGGILAARKRMSVYGKPGMQARPSVLQQVGCRPGRA